ncbi:MAG: anhydro-N-acetylmuramic acid kinase [Planctomycetia bacterium]|nr:anhydro-N-acetylmuramic acid kinase [Planctomycetia bacterium]
MPARRAASAARATPPRRGARAADVAWFVGLMSGTSADGVDAALVRVHARPGGRPRVTTAAALTVPYDAAFRARLLALPDVPAREVARLHVEVGERLAAAVKAVLRRGRVPARAVEAVASHGHTAVHLPRRGGGGATLQIGDPALIAERTGLAVVADFRPRDVAAGGEGAPLVPWVDRLLLAEPGRVVACQNVGGIANVTAVGPRVGDLVAFDTGPGMMLVDLAVAAATGGRARFDRGGAMAAAGAVDAGALAALLAHPYLRRRPPKSTGREAFGAPFLAPWLARARSARAKRDLVATLTAFTAASIADAYRRFLPPVHRCLVSGGGAHNLALLARLREELPGTEVATTAAVGIDPDFKEAVAFALLGWAHRRGRPNTVPAATGARREVVGGATWPGRAGGGA